MDATEQSTEQRVVVERLQGIDGVVVGDDNSSGAATAVHWAAADAARRGTTLHVVRAWSIHSAPRPSSQSGGYVPSLLEYQEAVRQQLEERWGSLRAQVPELDLVPVHQQSADALVEASETADVVVVGARGQGRVARIVVGSIAKDVVRQAKCPAVVVPQPNAED